MIAKVKIVISVLVVSVFGLSCGNNKSEEKMPSSFQNN